MSDLEELRTRVEAAEEHFGLIADQQKGYSQRLIALLNITEQKDQTIGKLEYENEQLRTMLFSLLQSIEKGDTTNTLQDMDARISAMTSEAVEIEDKSPDEDLSLPAPEDDTEEEVLDIEEDTSGSDTSASVENADEESIDEIEDLVADLESAESNMAIDEDTLSIDGTDESTDDETMEMSLEDISESDDISDSLESEQQEVTPEEISEEEISGDEISETVLEDDTTTEIADASEDDIIAEIADNLEEVLPTEEGGVEGAEAEAAAEDINSPLEGLEDPLEDQILSQAEGSEETTTTEEVAPPNETEISAEDIPLSEDTDIDSFLDENADDETKPGSPEIEDIMERISKQALSQGE